MGKCKIPLAPLRTRWNQLLIKASGQKRCSASVAMCAVRSAGGFVGAQKKDYPAE